MVGNILSGIEIVYNTDFLLSKQEFIEDSDHVIYTGPIDEYYDYIYGRLPYRSLKFEYEKLNIPDFQGGAVVNYTEESVPYTRICEHKFFDIDNSPIDHTIISREYPASYEETGEAYYPILTKSNIELYNRYKELANKENKVIFGGRLGTYKYYDMDQTIESAMNLAKGLL